MSKLSEVLNRLKRQYHAYEKERNNENEDGIIDISLACSLADSIPYLIKQAEKIDKINQLSNADELTLSDFAKETLLIIEERENMTRKASS
ncbi:hypothetical protein [Metabacillus arenae]|uniref:Uncharacterized protein n=1 Tax=Metabacillus arenae TaxID=2771434 RepID=A0A926NDC6_9BACI|nr:hypothetical protein [Metabacillus arenae]MBD1379151.1 hypothetical protein [Metabacillus arenae]